MSDTPNNPPSNPVSKIENVHIEDEMRGAYLDYAMSVIVGRALPDVRDGLKPVHRRSLYAMYDLGNTHSKPYKKSARVVGDVIGKYHPHGDTAVYDTIARMTQDFSLRYPLVDGQGNFGSIDGDAPAAMRYTEVRMEKITDQLLEDLEKDTVEFGPNYDDSLTEPEVLPCKFPNLLVNGSSGIAVGMATNIPPHNLTEMIDATIALIKDPEKTLQELIQMVKGPDFPTGGLILDGPGLKQAYTTGRGIIHIRGRAEIEPWKNDRERIVITELPYQVNKSRMIEKIADLVKNKRIEGISDLRDESDRSGMRVVIEVRKGENANILLNKLYKLTQLQESFGILMLAIHRHQPKLFNLKDMISAFIDHRKEVVLRRTAFDLKKAEAKAHVLEGLKKAVDHLDEVIALIKGSKSPADAKSGLMSQFSFSEIQAQAILDMRLHRLTGLEREKIVRDYEDVLNLIKRLKEILASETLVYDIIQTELEEIKEKFGDDRRTEITIDASADFNVEDLVADEETLVTITRKGYIKRSDPGLFRAQNRGGKGIKGAGTSGDDFVTSLYKTSTHSSLLCFTDKGKMYTLKVYEVPEVSRTAKGKAIVNLLPMAAGERVKAILPVKKFSADGYVVIASRAGVIKRISLSEFGKLRARGITVIGIRPGDEVIGAQLTDGKSELFMCSAKGKAIRFDENGVRAQGRSARGVAGMSLDSGDAVQSLVVLSPDQQDNEILTVTERGIGKRTPVGEYRAQTRGGKGLITMKVTEKNGDVVSSVRVLSKDDVMIVSDRGQMIRIRVGDISEQSRNTMGVRLMNVSVGEKVVGLEYMAEDNTDAESSENGS